MEQHKRTNYTRRLVSLGKATPIQIKEFKKISSNSRIMKNIGRGIPWSSEYVDELVKQTKQDEANNNPNYFHWLLLAKKENAKERVVGYVSLRPYKDNDLQIRTFVSPSGQGHGSAGGEIVMYEYYYNLGGDKKIYSVVKATNVKSVNMREKNPNWLLVSTSQVHGSLHKEFLYLDGQSDESSCTS